MTNVQSLNAISILLAVMFLVWFFYGPWKNFVIDLGRQNLFEIRDGLFMMAADGDIRFDDPAYIAVRNRINGMIRFCESFSFLLLFLDKDVVHASKVPTAISLVRSIADKKIAARVESKYKMALFVFILTMFFRSAWMIAASVFVLPFLALKNMLDGTRSATKAFDKFQRKVEIVVVNGDAVIA